MVRIGFRPLVLCRNIEDSHPPGAGKYLGEQLGYTGCAPAR